MTARRVANTGAITRMNKKAYQQRLSALPEKQRETEYVCGGKRI